MNKNFLKSFFLLTAIIIIFSGCLKKSDSKSDNKEQPNSPNGDVVFQNNLHYSNKDLKFSIDLPKNFKYYQTQRKNPTDGIEIEFFVPTSDTSYQPQEVPGYFKPLIIKIVKRDAKIDNLKDYTKLGENKEYWYYAYFNNSKPKDWTEEKEMKKNISNSFKMER